MMMTLFDLPGYWYGVSDRDARAVALYKRHYSYRQRVRVTEEITPPGESMVLLGANCDALFVWSLERHRRDGQHGVNCNVFRNESTQRSSTLIVEAMAAAWRRWPTARLFTFVDPRKVQSKNPGYCFQMAGWHKCGVSKKGLLIFEVYPVVALLPAWTLSSAVDAARDAQAA